MATGLPEGPPPPKAERRTLDPKLDVVFKILFSRNEDLLISLLTAVLQPAVPIASVTIVNYALPKSAVQDKGGTLDVLLRLEDGRLVDVEMQCRSQKGLRKRALLYWARLYGSEGGPGKKHLDWPPCVSIFFLGFRELPGERFHRIFQVLDVDDHEVFSDALQLHTIELPKVPAMVDQSEELELVRWSRFLAAGTDAELEELAMSDSTMGKAKEALDLLSADPTVQELARQRELAQWTYRFEMGMSRKEGIEEGRAEGRAEGLEAGRAQGEAAVRALVETTCEALGVPLDDERRQRLATMKLEQLEQLAQSLRTDKRWPQE